ncbi:hypothetical protein N752_25395 [Desulforamulus aquiferis]|nr:hypothetical protein [Desulforamulus aquiferis]RYD02659.1 hypothetical protein N752_25395 [Desulforamulus aquiferis]
MNLLIEEFYKSGALIVRPPNVGSPAIFSMSLRQELIGLQGDVGGRQIWQRHQEKIVTLKIDPGPMALDIDTPEDYRKVLQIFRGQHK